jgi:hypothetical protein
MQRGCALVMEGNLALVIEGVQCKELSWRDSHIECFVVCGRHATAAVAAKRCLGVMCAAVSSVRAANGQLIQSSQPDACACSHSVSCG